MKNKKSNIRLALVLSLTLGLAPFVPEPHIVGKVRWLMGGGDGMAAMDYFDLVLHGSPWMFLLYSTFHYFRATNRKAKVQQ